ncbi:metal-dependent hydrolase [Candidatus Woesearchaeota archaeon]|nr:metal-dependent hydrolase [Candidatus Woesearchaeota archaeon]
MPLAVTHVLLTIIVVDLYRDYVAKHKKYFTLHTVFIAGFAGLLPDIDIPLNWLLNFFGLSIAHGTITHTPLFGLIFLIPGFILWHHKKHRAGMYFFVACFGVLFHLFLDYFLGGGYYEGVMIFYPFLDTTFKLHLLNKLSIPNIPAAVDSIILLLWLWHEEIKHKISDFI